MKVQLGPIRHQNQHLAKALAHEGTVTGELLTIDAERYREIINRYCPEHLTRARCVGLGDVVAWLVWPAAWALDIKHCAPCSRRRRWLNRLFRICWG